MPFREDEMSHRSRRFVEDSAGNWPNWRPSRRQPEQTKLRPRDKIRIRFRCKLCGRPRAVYRKFGICRICFRDLASDGLIPGVKKASW